MNWVSWIIALVGPIVARAIAAAGFTAVVFTGVELTVTQLISSAQAGWSTMPLAVLQLATLSGIPEAIGIVFGAALARFTVLAAVGASRYVFTPK